MRLRPSLLSSIVVGLHVLACGSSSEDASPALPPAEAEPPGWSAESPLCSGRAATDAVVGVPFDAAAFEAPFECGQPRVWMAMAANLRESLRVDYVELRQSPLYAPEADAGERCAAGADCAATYRDVAEPVPQRSCTHRYLVYRRHDLAGVVANGKELAALASIETPAAAWMAAFFAGYSPKCKAGEKWWRRVPDGMEVLANARLSCRTGIVRTVVVFIARDGRVTPRAAADVRYEGFCD